MRLLIVDDHELVQRCIRSLISDRTNYEICGEAIDEQDALYKTCDLRPDLIVIDLSLPRLNGLEWIRQLRTIMPGCGVLALGQYRNSEIERQVRRAGARGYVVKNSISTDLIPAVAKVAQGDNFFDAAILDHPRLRHTYTQEILQPGGAQRYVRASEEQTEVQLAGEAEALRKLNECSSRLWQIRNLTKD
jgi:DNA-binding NarL/FixJ family response regulator